MAQKMILKNVRLSYAKFFEPAPASNEKDAPLKYSSSLIIPKDHKQIKELKKLILEAAKEKFGDKAERILKKGNPLRDGDEDRDDPAYEDAYFLNASSKRKPQVVDQQVQPIVDDSEIWSGCYANVSIAVYGYDKDVNKGVGVGLNNVQLVKTGERLGGAPNADEEFGEVETDDDDGFEID